MPEPTRQTTGRVQSLGLVIGLLAATLVVLTAGAFAVGRTSAPQTAAQTAYSQSAARHHGPMWSWARHHDGAWTRAHLGDLTWIRHHQAQWTWMRRHMGDVAWMRTHQRPMRWMQHQWDTRSWMHGYTGQRGWVRDHPHAWSSTRQQMRHMMRDHWSQNRHWSHGGSSWQR